MDFKKSDCEGSLIVITVDLEIKYSCQVVAWHEYEGYEGYEGLFYIEGNALRAKKHTYILFENKNLVFHT